MRGAVAALRRRQPSLALHFQPTHMHHPAPGRPTASQSHAHPSPTSAPPRTSTQHSCQMRRRQLLHRRVCEH